MRVRRMLGVLVVAVAVLVLGGSWARAEDPGRRSPVLRAVWVDTSSAVDAHALIAEARRLFAAMGVELDMRVGSPAAEVDPGFELRVVGVPNDVAHRSAAPLGETPTGGSRTVWVDCGRVAEVLEERNRHPVTARVLGTAAGRVAVHELVHAIAPERGHARSGLMAPRFGIEALEGPTLVVDTATRRAVEQHLAVRDAGDPGE